MKTFINIRGTNGSGKSTLARRFFGDDDATVPLCPYLTKYGKTKYVPGQVNPTTNVCVVGDYSTMAGGLDKVPTFAIQFEAIEAALALDDVEVVVAEGVLASTVLGSWADHARKLHESREARVIWAFLQTPVEVCIQRVKDRPKATTKKAFNEQLVRDKWNSIDRVRQKASALKRGEAAHPWIQVLELPYEQEWGELMDALAAQ